MVRGSSKKNDKFFHLRRELVRHAMDIEPRQPLEVSSKDHNNDNNTISNNSVDTNPRSGDFANNHYVTKLTLKLTLTKD